MSRLIAPLLTGFVLLLPSLTARADVSAPSAAPVETKPPPAATCTKSGLCSQLLKKGTGTKHPGAADTVTVHYSGWTTDGKMFDSSVQRGAPATFPLDKVIVGWTEGLQLMVDGEKRRFWIPEELAYKGSRIGPQGMLIFDVELLSFREAAKPIAAPADVKAPPREAKRTASGLAYRVLQKGDGTEHPNAETEVEVHYTGWTTDGKMFDSSVLRGAPATFRLSRLIPGWTEGVQLMVEGEKARFWIPVELAYKNQPGRPAGMLVFDVELLRIVKDAAQ